jgi:branched-chain amino acid transport system permease protein
MNVFTQILINGLISGAIYALIASGFSLIYTTNKFVNFAHGSIAIFGGYLFYWLFSALGFPFITAASLAICSSALFGYIINLILFKPLRKKGASSSILLVASIALTILIDSIILLLFGAQVKTIELSHPGPLQVCGAYITQLQIIIIASSLLITVALSLFVKKTKLGKAMRAVSDNRDAAEIMGISSKKIYGWSFAIGSFISGIAGVLIAMEQNLEPTMGSSLMIKGFTGAVIGGIGSVPGALLGSLILGLSENFGIWFLPSGYKDAIAFTILLVFLLFKAQGIFSVDKGLHK